MWTAGVTSESKGSCGQQGQLRTAGAVVDSRGNIRQQEQLWTALKEGQFQTASIEGEEERSPKVILEEESRKAGCQIHWEA